MDVESLAKQLILQNMSPEQQTAVLDGIKASLAQAKEVQKRKIGENVGVVVQALKKIESDIRERYDELGNVIEKRVASIKDGKDGKNGQDGRNGKDGRPGRDGSAGAQGQRGQDGTNGRNGTDGVSVVDAHIDFDGSLIIGLSSGRVINVGEVVASDLAEKIKVITNGGGTSQSVLDTLASLQTQINNLIPSQTGNSGKFLTTNGTALSWAGIAGGGLSYQGTWNANTNTPTLVSSTGTNGYYYITATAGSTNLDGITDWQIGDWLLFNGTVWQKIDQSNLVTSVAGKTGAVTLTTADVSGLNTMSVQAANNVSITGGSIAGITDLAVADGGTGASTAPDARTNLGLVIGTDVLAPNGSAASLTSFPTLNQNTTGTASNVTGVVAVANGGTGNATGTATINANLTGDVTSVGNASTLATVNSNVGAFTNANITVNAKGLITAAASGSPSGVTSVTGTSPVVSSGGTTPAISLAAGYGDTLNPYASKTANFVLAAPNGSAGVPTFRAVVANDIPTLNQNTTGTAANVTGTVAIANGGTGTTTLTANNVILGNGTSAVQFVAPSTSGNVLTSNGTTWASTPVSGVMTWQSVQTASFTAAASRAYPIDTTSSSIAVTLPASPAAGDQISFVDYAGTFATNNLIVKPNGNKINSTTTIRQIANNREAVTFVYIDATQGWIVANDGYLGTVPFATATVSAEYLVIAGGGGGGNTRAGGGGAGGYRTASGFSVSLSTNYTVTVGAGGAAGGAGSNSVFSTITSTGGGIGGSYVGGGGSGGSGGGGSAAASGGAGTSGQGNAGGAGFTAATVDAGGGGGGAGAVGGDAVLNTRGGTGGSGSASSITGTSVTRAGGGGGGATGTSTVASGGSGGGGNGGASGNAPVAGSTNLGGGGGGGTNTTGAAGGSGVVIIKYPSVFTISNPGGGLTFTTATASGFSVTTFTAGTGNVSWS